MDSTSAEDTQCIDGSKLVEIEKQQRSASFRKAPQMICLPGLSWNVGFKVLPVESGHLLR